MSATVIGTGRAVEVLHDRGLAAAADADRWADGSGCLIGGRLVLTAAHNVGYRTVLGADEQLLVRTIDGREFAARVVLACDEASKIDLALLEISDPRFDDHVPAVSFAQVSRRNPEVPGCWAVGFPRFSETGPVLPEGSRRETWQARGDILPGAKQRAGLLVLQVSSAPEPLPAGSAWAGMSGAVVFAAGPGDGELAVGVISTHHRPEGGSSLTVVPVTAIAGLPAAARWRQQLGVADPASCPSSPRCRRLASGSPGWGQRALKEHWDPRGRGVERAARPGWFFTGRRQALSELVAWLTAAPAPADNVRVVAGGPVWEVRGAGPTGHHLRSAVPGRPAWAGRRRPGRWPGRGVIDVAVHARTAPAGEVVSALAAAAGAPQADLDRRG
jgi:hypothetical protein